MPLAKPKPTRAAPVADPKKAARPKRRDRRGEILDAAKSLFARRGFEATGIREIADEVGLLSGSLYHYFGTKEDMLHAIVKDFVMHLLKSYESVAEDNQDARETLRRMIRFGTVESIKNKEIHCIVVRDRQYFASREDFQYIEAAWHDVFRIWYGVLYEGVRAGLFRSNIDLHLVLRMIIEQMNSTVMWFRPGGRYSIEEVVEAQCDFVLHALEKDPQG